MNTYIVGFLVILILLFIFLYWLPLLRRRINIDQERIPDKEPGGEEEYYRILKEGKKYREELKRKGQ